MKLLSILSIVSLLVAIAAANHGANEVGEQVVNPADWHGSWSALNRYQGQTYTCPVGNTLYGVYSNAGFFYGTINDRTVEGVWFEGGRGDRNYYQGSFKITISDDNQEFDGYFNRLTTGEEFRWHESRLGAPYPSNPTLEDCFAPDETVENILGSFYRSTETGALAGSTFICKDYWEQVYGSFHSPDGYIAGWSVDDSTGFHGYRYDSTGQSGAYILRALTRDRLKGFYWRGILATQNHATTKYEAFNRSAFTAKLDQCEQVGPGFVERLHGPDYVPYYLVVNSSSVVSFSFLVVALAALLF